MAQAVWSLYLCDLNGVRLRNISPVARQLVYSSRMNTPSSLGFTVPSDDARISTAHTDTYPMLDEGRRTVKAYRNGVLRFCGIVWTVTDAGDTDGKVTSAVTCYDHMIRLRRRFSLTEAATGVGVTSRDGVAFRDMDGGWIIRHLIRLSNVYEGHVGLEVGARLYRDVVIASTPGVYYRMDAGPVTAYDQSGNGRNGVKGGTFNAALPVNGPVAGDNNLAIQLDGATNWLEIPAGLNPNDTFTVEFWIKPTNNTGSQYIYDQGGANGARIVKTNTGAIQLERVGTVICTSSSTLSPGTWVYVTVAKTGATVRIRFNKTDVTGTIANQTITTTNQTQGVAANRVGSQNYLAASLDEFAVYTTALSTATCDDHYDAASIVSPDATYGAVFEASSTVTGTVAYKRRDLQSILYELATAYNGFDVEVVPLDRTDGKLNRLDIKARLGSDKPTVIFGWGLPPSNLKRVEKLDSMEQVANDIEGMGAADIISRQTDSTSITAYGRYSDVDSFGDLSNQTLVTALTTEELGFRVAAKELVAFTPMPYTTGLNVPQPWDDYWLGDTLRLRVGAKLRNGFTATFRVYGVDVARSDDGQEVTNAIYLQAS